MAERRRAARPAQRQAFELTGQQAGDDKVAQPAMIGRNHVPGCRVAVGAPQHLGPLRLVIGEVAMVAQIAQGQFPAFFRMIQTAMQPPLLLAERELQVALEG